MTKQNFDAVCLTCRYSKRPALCLLDVARFTDTLSRTTRALPPALKVAKKLRERHRI